VTDPTIHRIFEVWTGAAGLSDIKRSLPSARYRSVDSTSIAPAWIPKRF